MSTLSKQSNAAWGTDILKQSRYMAVVTSKLLNQFAREAIDILTETRKRMNRVDVLMYAAETRALT
jgi:hypothetical protein